MNTIVWLLLAAVLTFSSCLAQPQHNGDAFDHNRQLGRGVNFGNALEAPNEGDWGMVLEESYFEAIKAAGFDSVRLPIKWSAHASETAPYEVSAALFARVDWAVDQALSRELTIILDFHHYDEMFTAPEVHVERWLGIWAQLAEHYRNAPDSIYFELLNEPNGKLTSELWNDYIARALTLIRQSNPRRMVIVGPTGWNAIGNLNDLELPADPNLIVTVHYYEPFAFTHQGAEWVTPSPPVGQSWLGDTLNLAGGVQNWSWDTALEFTAAGPVVTFKAGWAGFYLHPDAPFKGYDSLRVTTQNAPSLRVVCNEDETAVHSVPHGAVTELSFTVNLAACGAKDELSALFLMNDSDTAQAPFTVTELTLEGASGSLPLLSSERQAVATALDTAARWGELNNRPIFLGEFGAYESGDMASRARWTAAVRDTAEANGMSWAYWEFGAGFGVYDRSADTWQDDLLTALIP